MGPYQRGGMRPSGPAAPSTPPTDFRGHERDLSGGGSDLTRVLRPVGALGHHHYAANNGVTPFLRPAFPQEEGGVIASRLRESSPGVAQDTAAAAGNLLSLIQSIAPTRQHQYQYPPRNDGELRLSNLHHLLHHDELRPNESVAEEEGDGSTSDEQVPVPAVVEEPVRPVKRAKRRQQPQLVPGETDGSTPTSSAAASPKRKSKRNPTTPVLKRRAVEKETTKKPAPKRKRRDKKPTYIVRREKKELLEVELRELQTQVVELRRASGIPDSFFIEREQLALRIQDNARLRSESRKQDMLLCNAHSLLSAEYVMMRSESPIETFIHLTTDLKQRRAALIALKDVKLGQADAFITERSKLLPRTKPWCQEAKFETPDGHYCAEKMDNTPFRGAESLRQVFDALQFFFRNMEISISEMLGDITVREDDDSTASNSFSNHRLVSTMAHGIKVEKNIVKFFKLVEPDVDDEVEETGEANFPYALVATDSVDVDDMYPYVPEERIRMDINAAMKFTEHRCKKQKSNRQATKDSTNRHVVYGDGGVYIPQQEEDEEDEEDEYERVVVLTRWFRVKLHRTELDLPPHVLQEIRQGLACFSDTMVQTMHRVIYQTR